VRQTCRHYAYSRCIVESLAVEDLENLESDKFGTMKGPDGKNVPLFETLSAEARAHGGTTAVSSGLREGTASVPRPLPTVDPKVVEALVAETTRRDHSPLNELTPRERDVLREMAEGKNNAAIAEALRLSERTVEKVIHAIFLKLGLAWETTVHKRVKAVIFYLSGTAAETRPAERSS